MDAKTGSTFSAQKAHRAQELLSKRIMLEDKLPSVIRLIGGVDVAYSGNIAIGAAAVLDYGSFELIESKTARCKIDVPYIPTLLAFREMRPVVMSVQKLENQPDVFLIDAHGLAHPYHFGFASQFGLALKVPTIGVAKQKLLGDVETVRAEDDVKFLIRDGEIVGAEVVTKRGSKPVYVSVGHMVSLRTAIKIVKHCTTNNRVPEPILAAHKIASSEKRKIN